MPLLELLPLSPLGIAGLAISVREPPTYCESIRLLRLERISSHVTSIFFASVGEKADGSSDNLQETISLLAPQQETLDLQRTIDREEDTEGQQGKLRSLKFATQGASPSLTLEKFDDYRNSYRGTYWGNDAAVYFEVECLLDPNLESLLLR